MKALRGLWPCFRAELRDLTRSSLIWLGLLLTAVGTYFIGKTTPHRFTSWSAFAEAAKQGGAIAAFFLVFAGAITLAGERTRGTVRWILPRPVGRTGFVLGKACALAVLATLFLILCLGSAALAGSDLGFGDVPMAGGGGEADGGWKFTEEVEQDANFTAATLQARALWASLILLPALLTAAGLGMLISSWTRSAAGAVFSALFLLMMLHYLPDVLGLANDVAAASPLRATEGFWVQLRDFGRGLSSAQWPSYGAQELGGALVFVLGLPLAAALVFGRAELTD